MPTSPTPPIELLGKASRLTSTSVEVPQEALAALASICETIESDTDLAADDAVARAARRVPGPALPDLLARLR